MYKIGLTALSQLEIRNYYCMFKVLKLELGGTGVASSFFLWFKL